MKKIISILMAAVLMIAAATTVLAGGHGKTGTVSSRYTVCSVESCVKTGLHTHTAKTYAAHYYGDGHDYHDYCGITDCLYAGYHEHDGAYCFTRTASENCDYRNTGGCHR